MTAMNRPQKPQNVVISLDTLLEACVVVSGLPPDEVVEDEGSLETGEAQPSQRRVQLMVHASHLIKNLDWWNVLDYVIEKTIQDDGIQYLADVIGAHRLFEHFGVERAVRTYGAPQLLDAIGKEAALKHFGVQEAPASKEKGGERKPRS